MASLKPLELKSEEKNYKAHSEKTTLQFKKCDHKMAKMVRNELRCQCGASWSGPRINELLKHFTGK